MAELLQNQNKAPGQALQKPPFPFWLVKARADAILDLSSTDPKKAMLAEKAQAKVSEKISFYEKKIDNALLAKDAASEEDAQNKVNFLSELFEYVETLYRTFDRKKKAFNTDKERIQNDLEDRLQRSWLKSVQKYIPILSGPLVGGAVLGTGIWEALTGKLPGILKEVVNLVGLALIGGVSYGIDLLVGRRRSKLTDKYMAKNGVIDGKEEDIRLNVLRLVEIEYDRLAKVYSFQPFKITEDTEHAQAHKIVKDMEQKYGVHLPLPDSLLNGVPAQAKVKRWRAFRSKIGEAFSVLLASSEKPPQVPAEAPKPASQ
ncbi:MAG: hypothetical protein WC861_00685 [Candidatus Micrarchaeia archaeon]|jgi:hypothetical protein